jgi:hypothetical protein
VTAPALTKAEELVARIREAPHWRFLVQPLIYSQRFSDRKAALLAVQESAVHLRGWDFPHFEDVCDEHGGNEPIVDGWESWNAFGNLEAWRVMRSGQFVYLANLEQGYGGPQTVDLEFVVYRLTELLLFASHLTGRRGVDYKPGVRLEAGLKGIEGYRIGSHPRRFVRDHYHAKGHDATSYREQSLAQVRYEWQQTALDMTMEIFQWFGYEPPANVIRGIQEKLLARDFS